MSDPRIYFAAERTLLAWVRTGIGVMAFGFVVARFGLFMRMLPADPAAAPSSLAPFLGIGLVALGVISTAVGAAQYRQYAKTLPATDLPSAGRTMLLPLIFAWTIVVFGALLVWTMVV